MKTGDAFLRCCLEKLLLLIFIYLMRLINYIDHKTLLQNASSLETLYISINKIRARHPLSQQISGEKKQIHWLTNGHPIK